MNIFRIPLNAFVVLLLLKIKYLSPRIVFSVCTGAHAVAFLCYYYFRLVLPTTTMVRRTILYIQTMIP
jgi:hypothetical protein